MIIIEYDNIALTNDDVKYEEKRAEYWTLNSENKPFYVVKINTMEENNHDILTRNFMEMANIIKKIIECKDNRPTTNGLLNLTLNPFLKNNILQNWTAFPKINGKDEE
jgi:hypothetical protein